jgi:hypothetical protein
MGPAYTGLRRLRLAAVRPETVPQSHERWRAATALPPRLFWEGRATWLQVRPGAAVTSEQVAAGS